MKRTTLLAFGILPASLLAARVTSHAGVYAHGIYSCGHTDYGFCATTLPFPPYQFDIDEDCWQEDANGYTISPFNDRTPQPTDVSRRTLEVKYGSQTLNLQLEAGPPRRYKTEGVQSLTKDEGDLWATLTRCVAARGGQANTNSLSVLKAIWFQHSTTNEDFIVLDGDRFTEIQHLLERAYGLPDATVHSSNPSGGIGRSINYTPAQIGVLLNLTVSWDETTIISILKKQEPRH